MLRGKPLGAICIAVLCGILVAGLWPFHSPRNAVTWLGERNGLRFGDAGTIVSAGEVRLTAPPESACSLEVWVQPARRYDSNTLLAFYTPENPLQLSLHQSITDLKLEHGAGRGRYQSRTDALYIGDVFGSMRPVFLSISSGAQGTAVYIDGTLARASRQFRITAGDCTGRLVVATSPVSHDRWTGELRGLAIYHRELTAPQVVRHYETWTRKGRPEVAGDEGCIALYLFEERSGERIHNQIAPGGDLLIPEQYLIQDEVFLRPFWKEFSFSWGYWKSNLKNILGLVPLGFFFYAWFSSKTSAQRAAWITTVLGAMVSVTIEVLQAYLPTRDSGTTDILTNTLGTWAGAMLYRHVAGRGVPRHARGL